MSNLFKSKLFNFINQRSIQLRSTGDRVLRHLQVGAMWGLQVVVYPVYVAIQATRYANYQLKHGSTKHSPQEGNYPSPPSDQCTNKVLKSTPIKEVNPDDDLQIQGLGCDLISHNIVLITPDNQSLDIFTPDQQKKLQKRISGELVNYWVERRAIASENKGFSGKLQTPKDEQNLLAPIRFFWRLITWVQRGDVATHANLFSESNIIVSESESNINPFDFNPPHFPMESVNFFAEKLILLDEKFADLETNIVIPEVEQVTGKITRYTQPFIQRIRGTLVKQDVNQDLAQLDQNPDISQLIKDALNYFFGKYNIKLPGVEYSDRQLEKSAITPGSNVSFIYQHDEDPWLLSPDTSSEHKYLLSEEKRLNSGQKTPIKLALPGRKLPKITTTIVNFIQRYFSGASSAITLVKPQSKIKAIVKRQSEVTDIVKSQSEVTDITVINPQSEVKDIVPNSEDNIVNNPPKPVRKKQVKKEVINPKKSHEKVMKKQLNSKNNDDWIETEATPKGYVKHPLIKALETLDNIMLFIEELVIKIWRFIKSIFIE